MNVEDSPLLFALVAIVAYLLGSIPFGLLLTRAAGLGDIRAIGSGSIGATNVLRTGRKSLALATLLLDFAKGALAVLIGARAAGTIGISVAAFAAVLGHLYPVWLGFRGGKGVATGFGVLLAATPFPALVAALVWLGMAGAFRISSLASLTAALAAPIIAALFGVPFLVVATEVVIAGFIWQRHKANIARLVAGTEPRIGK
jgi:glycerol-3-phosphate acyltransferase PlsY